ncbi:hypothetical protein [uncultured Stenotrophomonas sp.]|uniref:hypothetical protein n=1 Tax=uncultured Stenotrophomonas sp. TaxID=165438 RepID=UPI0025F53573|nr:hypothetical protein [uncultured Stenotrophomonas sp.]
MPHAMPPLPAKLREMLKDYPEHIQALQKCLISVLDENPVLTHPFEMAVWFLEDCLTSFIIEASSELDTANAASDADAILRAEQKLRLMFRARSGNGGMKGMHELWDYFHEGHGD